MFRVAVELVMQNQAGSKLVVERAITIDAAASRVWEIIVAPAQWPHWMLVVPELEGGPPLRLGSRVLWRDERGKTYLTGTVTVLEPGRALEFELFDVSWPRPAKRGEVTYRLALVEEGGRTHVSFTLGDLSIDPEGPQWRDAYAASRELEAIKELAEAQSFTSGHVETPAR